MKPLSMSDAFPFRAVAALLLALCLLSLIPACAQPPEDTEWVELHRLRIANRKDGAVQVSTDAGKTWTLIGRVTIPATSVKEGYLASGYADQSTIAATAVHGLRIRVGDLIEGQKAPAIFTIDPKEYSGAVNKGYGGYVAGTSGIFTDIPAAGSIFRNLAPLVGNPVLLQDRDGLLSPLAPGFVPAARGETLLIVVRRPKNPVVEVVFENRAGGSVRAKWADGTTREVTKVVGPVRGVGRFDATAFTGVGRINTAHSGVITVSTAPIDAAQPEGVGRERRGGFQICPVWHNSRTDEAGTPMIMTVGTPGAPQRELEGRPPLFRDMVSLATGDDGAIVDVAIDGGAWEPMPTLVGLRLDAFTGPGLTRIWKQSGTKRAAKRGVTAFRLRMPVLTPERSSRMAAAAAEAYRKVSRASANAGRMPVVKGLLTINANPTSAEGVAYVRFAVDGTPRGFTNRKPYTLTWDTTTVPDGEYQIEAEALTEEGTVLSTTLQRVYVENALSPATAQPARTPAGGLPALPPLPTPAPAADAPGTMN